MLKKEEMEVFRGVLWRSWYRRKQYLMDFRAANRRPEPMAVEQRPALVWKPSTRGLFKFNVDAAVSFPLNLVRLGLQRSSYDRRGEKGGGWLVTNSKSSGDFAWFNIGIRAGTFTGDGRI
ncbi:hypothetical protein ACOSP7_028663 [Xanthoceras sorbifolium]